MADGVVEEDAVHCLPDGVLTTEGKREVADATADTAPGARLLQHQRKQLIYRGRLYAMDAARIHRESGQIARTSQLLPTIQPLSAHPGDCFGTSGNEEIHCS